MKISIMSASVLVETKANYLLNSGCHSFKQKIYSHNLKRQNIIRSKKPWTITRRAQWGQFSSPCC
jgi:hypothetical protein